MASKLVGIYPSLGAKIQKGFPMQPDGFLVVCDTCRRVIGISGIKIVSGLQCKECISASLEAPKRN